MRGEERKKEARFLALSVILFFISLSIYFPSTRYFLMYSLTNWSSINPPISIFVPLQFQTLPNAICYSCTS